MTKLHAFDSCVVSNFLKPRAEREWPSFHGRVQTLIATEGGYALPSIAIFEISRGLRELEIAGRDIKKVARTRRFLFSATELPTSGDVLGLAVEVWARARINGQTIPDHDLLVACTAMHHDRIIVTTDTGMGAWMNENGYQAWLELLPLA